MTEIVIEYDGKYPNLCSGKLVVIIDGYRWEFPDYSLETNGTVWFDDDWEEHVEIEPWEITSWPKDFPEELKEAVHSAVNDQIEHGCCGGCI